jgi:hypothetical protein
MLQLTKFVQYLNKAFLPFQNSTVTYACSFNKTLARLWCHVYITEDNVRTRKNLDNCQLETVPTIQYQYAYVKLEGRPQIQDLQQLNKFSLVSMKPRCRVFQSLSY